MPSRPWLNIMRRISALKTFCIVFLMSTYVVGPIFESLNSRNSEIGSFGLDWIGFFVFISIIHLKEKAQRLFKEKAQEKQGFE